MCILNSSWTQCTTCTWSRDLNTHLSHPRSGRCAIHVYSGPENRDRIPHPGQRAACVVDSSDVGQESDVGCLGCGCGCLSGKAQPGSMRHVRVLRWETSSLRADAELLGLAKMLGCEEAKQTLGIYKQGHRHLRAP